MKLKRAALPILGVLGLALLILWSGGFLATGRIQPGKVEAVRLTENPLGDQSQAQQVAVTEWYEAVGTVRPRTKTRIQAQVRARIEQVLVVEGDRVSKGDALVVLDSRSLQSQLAQARDARDAAEAQVKQARENIKAARAAFDRASAQYRRIKALYEQGAVADDELDAAEAEYLQTEAGVSQARDGLTGAQAAMQRAANRVEEARIALDHATIEAHEAGEIAERAADPGDLAIPGKTLLVLQASGSLRLEALVSEGLVHQVPPGNELTVHITATDATVQGVVEEVVPLADPRTRTFLVKVGLQPMAGLYPGMFGRVLVPMGEREAVLVPRSAVLRVGQLETVWVKDQGAWSRVFIKAGQQRDGMVEALAGLSGGETVAVPPGETPVPPEQALPLEGGNG